MLKKTLILLAIALAFAPAGFAQTDAPPPLFIDAYAGKVSYKPGDDLTLHVSTSAPKYALEIARLGARREVVLAKKEIDGAVHKVPENASSHGCDWPASFTFKLPPIWQSGYYQVVLKVEDQGGQFVQRNKRSAESECFFILRPEMPDKGAKILLQLSTNTYNACNNWGGYSVEAQNSRAKLQGQRVCFLRPPASRFRDWELPFAAWAEANGYALDYCANLDLQEADGQFLANYKLILSVGQDEYWSARMRDQLDAFIQRGGNVAFFSAACCWQVRPEDQNDALVAYKQRYNQDPVFRSGDHRQLTTLWSHHLVNRPENDLTGVGFLWGGLHKSRGQLMDGDAAFRVHRPEHWIFEGTKLKKDDKFGANDSIVGPTCAGCEILWKDGLPFPTHRDGTPKNFTILGSCPAKWTPEDALWYERFERDRVGNAVLGIHEKTGTVFTCGSANWAHGLRGKDAIVERITRNILDKLAK